MLNKYKKLNNESNLEYQYRISTMKDEVGTWQDVADIINEELGYEYGESKYRKDFASFSKLFSANQNKLTDTDIALSRTRFRAALAVPSSRPFECYNTWHQK